MADATHAYHEEGRSWNAEWTAVWLWSREVAVVWAARWPKPFLGLVPKSPSIANIGKGIPIGRMGTAQEYANLACFLASDAGSYVTGTAINLDGGASPVV